MIHFCRYVALKYTYTSEKYNRQLNSTFFILTYPMLIFQIQIILDLFPILPSLAYAVHKKRLCFFLFFLEIICNNHTSISIYTYYFMLKCNYCFCIFKHSIEFHLRRVRLICSHSSRLRLRGHIALAVNHHMSRANYVLRALADINSALPRPGDIFRPIIYLGLGDA